MSRTEAGGCVGENRLALPETDRTHLLWGVVTESDFKEAFKSMLGDAAGEVDFL